MTKLSPFRYFKTSREIIRLAVMLYVRFPLSLRYVEDLLHERGIEVSHEGEVLESFVTKTRDKKAALKFLKKTMRKHGQPNVIVTDRLRSHGAALNKVEEALDYLDRAADIGTVSEAG